MTYPLCSCLLRMEPHWWIVTSDEWMSFAASRGLVTSEVLRERLVRPGDPAMLHWNSIRLFLGFTLRIWHEGAVEDHPFEDEAAWVVARSMFVAHPERDGMLWHPGLEEIRKRECG